MVVSNSQTKLTGDDLYNMRDAVDAVIKRRDNFSTIKELRGTIPSGKRLEEIKGIVKQAIDKNTFSDTEARKFLAEVANQRSEFAQEIANVLHVYSKHTSRPAASAPATHKKLIKLWNVNPELSPIASTSGLLGPKGSEAYTRQIISKGPQQKGVAKPTVSKLTEVDFENILLAAAAVERMYQIKGKYDLVEGVERTQRAIVEAEAFSVSNGSEASMDWLQETLNQNPKLAQEVADILRVYTEKEAHKHKLNIHADPTNLPDTVKKLSQFSGSQAVPTVPSAGAAEASAKPKPVKTSQPSLREGFEVKLVVEFKIPENLAERYHIGKQDVNKKFVIASNNNVSKPSYQVFIQDGKSNLVEVDSVEFNDRISLNNKTPIHVLKVESGSNWFVIKIENNGRDLPKGAPETIRPDLGLIPSSQNEVTFSYKNIQGGSDYRVPATIHQKGAAKQEAQKAGLNLTTSAPTRSSASSVAVPQSARSARAGGVSLRPGEKPIKVLAMQGGSKVLVTEKALRASAGGNRHAFYAGQPGQMQELVIVEKVTLRMPGFAYVVILDGTKHFISVAGSLGKMQNFVEAPGIQGRINKGEFNAVVFNGMTELNSLKSGDVEKTLKELGISQRPAKAVSNGLVNSLFSSSASAPTGKSPWSSSNLKAGLDFYQKHISGLSTSRKGEFVFDNKDSRLEIIKELKTILQKVRGTGDFKTAQEMIDYMKSEGKRELIITEFWNNGVTQVIAEKAYDMVLSQLANPTISKPESVTQRSGQKAERSTPETRNFLNKALGFTGEAKNPPPITKRTTRGGYVARRQASTQKGLYGTTTRPSSTVASKPKSSVAKGKLVPEVSDAYSRLAQNRGGSKDAYDHLLAKVKEQLKEQGTYKTAQEVADAFANQAVNDLQKIAAEMAGVGVSQFNREVSPHARQHNKSIPGTKVRRKEVEKPREEKKRKSGKLPL